MTALHYCPHCRKSFEYDPDDYHRKISCSNEKCGKKFGSNVQLKNHINQSHSPAFCQICSKEIANAYELKRHKVFVHKDTKGVWLCDSCPKKIFFSQTMFEKHMRDKH